MFLAQTVPLSITDFSNSVISVSKSLKDVGLFNTIISIALMMIVAVFILAVKYFFYDKPFDKIKKLVTQTEAQAISIAHYEYLRNLSVTIRDYVKESYRIKTSLSISSFELVVGFIIGSNKSFKDVVKYEILNYLENKEESNNRLTWVDVEGRIRTYFNDVIMAKIKLLTIFDDSFTVIIGERLKQLVETFLGNFLGYIKENLPDIKIRLNEDLDDLVNNIGMALNETYGEIILKDKNFNYISTKDI